MVHRFRYYKYTLTERLKKLVYGLDSPLLASATAIPATVGPKRSTRHSLRQSTVQSKCIRTPLTASHETTTCRLATTSALLAHTHKQDGQKNHDTRTYTTDRNNKNNLDPRRKKPMDNFPCVSLGHLGLFDSFGHVKIILHD